MDDDVEPSTTPSEPLHRRRTPSERIRRWLFRAPVKLFDWKLDRLLGARFLLLEHVGRRSGLPRRTVLEVIDVLDGHPVVASGYGHRSDWYHNITATPAVTVTWRRRRFEATARRLEHDAAVGLFIRYQRDHARAARGLAERLGVPVDRDPHVAAEAIPVFELVG